MKKITAILGVLAAVASLSLADSSPEASAKDTKKVVQNNFVETAQKGVKLSGYVDAEHPRRRSSLKCHRQTSPKNVQKKS